MVGLQWGWIVVAVGLVGACGPAGSGSTAESGVSDESGDTGETTGEPPETTGVESSSESDAGDDSTGVPVMCTRDQLGDLELVRTAGISELSGVLEVILANSPSHECGGLGCSEGWQARVRLDVTAAGPQALGTAVDVHFSSTESDCVDTPSEPCECPEAVSTDESTPWTGTVEIVGQDDDCMQLRFIDTDLFRLSNEQDLPTTFGAVATRCE